MIVPDSDVGTGMEVDEGEAPVEPPLGEAGDTRMPSEPFGETSQP